MQIELTGHQMDLTEALKDHIQSKFNKLEKHFEKITSIHVILNVEKLRQIAEATILVAKEKFHASSEDENMYTAIDSLADKLNKQLIRHKEKLKAHH